MEAKQLNLVVAGARYLSIVGETIDDIGRHGIPAAMPMSYHENRVARDKDDHYHITFAHNVELKAYMTKHSIPKSQRSKQLYKMIKSLVDTFGDPNKDWELPVDLGLGRVEEQPTDEAPRISYFRVIHWPFGQKLRAHLGLGPTHFHITIGFDPKDIHLPKGPNTLLLDYTDDDWVQRWVKSALDYPDETIFLRRLYDYLILSGQKELADPWLHLLPPQKDRK